MTKVPIELLRILIEFSNTSVIKFERKRTKRSWEHELRGTQYFFSYSYRRYREQKKGYITYISISISSSYKVTFFIESARFLTSCFLNYFIFTALGNITQCDKCFNDNYALCQNDTEIQNCMFPATDSCFTVAGRYKFRGSKVVGTGVARGCGFCPSKTMFV